MVSIIMPTYNRDQLIEQTLLSIKNQSYTNWECILVDDHSTDDTVAVIKSFINNDHRFQFYKRPEQRQKGASACRNFGFEKAKGKYVQFFDSDDIMHKAHLQEKVAAFQDKSVDLVLCKIQWFSGNFSVNKLKESSKTYSGSNLFEDLVLGKLTMGMITPMWRKAFLNGKVLLDESIVLNEDLEFHARLLIEKPNYKFIDEALIYVRLGENSITNNYFKTPELYIGDYLEVKRRILALDPGNTKVNKGLIKIMMAQFRACLALQDYVSSSRLLKFIDKHRIDKSLPTTLKITRVKLLFSIFKFLGRGDTRFKKMLKI